MGKKKILVTGAGGYIGSIAISLFLKKGYEVVGLDNFVTGFKEPLEILQKQYGKESFRFYKLDLTKDISTVFEKEKVIEAAVHYGALIVVDESMREPQKYFKNNVCGSINLLSTMIQYGVKNIVFSSTAAVYGDAKVIPVDEDQPAAPLNPYGQSKRMIEEVIQWYGKLLGLNYIIFRYFNVCGATEDGSLGYSKTPSTHLVQNAVKGALKIEPFYLTCPEVQTKDKSPIRDYVNVLDLNDAHVKAVDYLLKGGKSEIINLGTGEGNSVLEIVDTVQKIEGVKFDIQKSKPREGENAVLIASIKKAKKLLGWEPKRTIDDSIKSVSTWYRAHPKGWSN